MDEKEEQKVIEALENGDYTVSIEEPNNLSRCVTPSGREFFVAYGDDVKFGVSGGSCTVEVCGHSFTCDLSNGDWDEEMSEELQDALEGADGVFSGEMLDLEEQALVYARANNRDPDEIELYWCEDDDKPVDADDVESPLHWSEETIEFDGKKYYTVEEPEQEESDDDKPVFVARAIVDGTVADDYGYYSCVRIVYQAVPDKDDEDEYSVGEIVRIEDCDSSYNGVDGGFDD